MDADSLGSCPAETDLESCAAARLHRVLSSSTSRSDLPALVDELQALAGLSLCSSTLPPLPGVPSPFLLVGPSTAGGETCAHTAAEAVAAAAAVVASALLAAAVAAAAVTPAVANDGAQLGAWPMREFSSLAQGYAACEAEVVAFPFVVRSCAEFAAVASEAAVRAQLALEADVTAYRDDADGYTHHEHQSGASALAAWETSASTSYSLNIIDAEATRPGRALLPLSLQRLPGVELVSTHLRLAYVLSPVPSVVGSFGALHVDPPMGSGWQYLCRGRKTWHVVDASSTRRYTRAGCRAERVPPDSAFRCSAVEHKLLRGSGSASVHLFTPI